jgi:hypothetical protein
MHIFLALNDPGSSDGRLGGSVVTALAPMDVQQAVFAIVGEGSLATPGELCLNDLGLSDLAVSDLAVSDLDVSDLDVSDLAVSDLAVSDLDESQKPGVDAVDHRKIASREPLAT